MGGGAAVAFPPFVKNERDALYIFNDSAFHQACVDSHPKAQAAIAARHEAIEHRLRRAVCVVCGERIEESKDSIWLGLLTSDSTNSLYEFNNLSIHHSHFKGMATF